MFNSHFAFTLVEKVSTWIIGEEWTVKYLVNGNLQLLLTLVTVFHYLEHQVIKLLSSPNLLTFLCVYCYVLLLLIHYYILWASAFSIIL